MRHRSTLARAVPIDLLAAASNAVELAASLIAKNAIKPSAQTLARESVWMRLIVGLTPNSGLRRGGPVAGVVEIGLAGCRLPRETRPLCTTGHAQRAQGRWSGEGFLDDSSS